MRIVKTNNDYKSSNTGVNASSISDVTGIPRATCARKLEKLTKLGVLEQESKSNDLDNLINVSKPVIFWKEKPLVKRQLSIWSLDELEKMISGINNIELLCKKNPQISKVIFFNFFLEICTKANNYS